MQFEQQTPDALLVSGYAGTGFVAGGRSWPALLVTPSCGYELAARDLAALDLAAFDPLLTHHPATELLLIGTGPMMRRPPAALIAALVARALAVEFMDSRAAARTYNVLVAEGRRVAAALLPTG